MAERSGTEPAPVFQLWAKSGVQFSNYKEDFTGSSIKIKASPLTDEYFLSQYRRAIADSKRYDVEGKPKA